MKVHTLCCTQDGGYRINFSDDGLHTALMYVYTRKYRSSVRETRREHRIRVTFPLGFQLFFFLFFCKAIVRFSFPVPVFSASKTNEKEKQTGRKGEKKRAEVSSIDRRRPTFGRDLEFFLCPKRCYRRRLLFDKWNRFFFFFSF